MLIGKEGTHASSMKATETSIAEGAAPHWKDFLVCVSVNWKSGWAPNELKV
jgi:hypothetical protein